ncbi:NAD(P)-dependent oxidoreductase [Sulfurospirillum multivorans]|uniref:NADPH-dependent glutamate synthase subunit beta-like oxidoreductase n=2 Tax=Sulfurospirillum multivorans TaxID=66821 RepID=A0AA86ALA1_SULMK|nr:NAD(P)-dependent oxidoreductase [Sulfurospirillum multivorans]AHJ12905.1 NADPH-dependent glutamate synthase subunit beta-like oxidoreductase [Sulfurospirillum multivorans DSM 12446]QEH06396.1 NADPH-dependent glutamate synthase subunit beta-like oxidoreductase [Sulfurospirillum multivorans]
MNKYVITLAKTCLGCKKPSCRTGCPVGTPIPEMIRLFLAGEIKEAGKLLFDNNPLSVICSMVCPHEKHCEGHCILNKKGTAVSVGSIENYISDLYMNDLQFEKPIKNGKKVAIIGSGPAGISLAVILGAKGYEITMYDAHDKIGGVLRYGIPDFRLNKEILDTIETKLRQLDVTIRPNITIGKNITIADLFRDDFKAIFIGTGVWAPKKLGIKGESLGHVHFAIDYLKNPAVYRLGHRVVILGAGNVAMDVARTAVRHGAREVIIMYRKGMEDIPASHHEVECAKIDGVKFELYKQPIEITEQGVIYASTDESGEEGLLEADSILIAISQSPNDNIVQSARQIEVDGKGLVITDESGRTTMEGVFASGDVVTGARTVVEAVAFSKRAAVAIEEYVDSL